MIAGKRDMRWLWCLLHAKIGDRLLHMMGRHIAQQPWASQANVTCDGCGPCFMPSLGTNYCT